MLHKDEIRKNEIRELLSRHYCHLRKLKEQQASFGLYTPPHILTEIEDKEAVIEQLEAEFRDLTQPEPKNDSCLLYTSYSSHCCCRFIMLYLGNMGL